jgi:N-acyl-D-aspartate/D-glutamate deacylase
MATFDEKTLALNIVALVGHATVRRQIMGDDYKRAATPDEILRMSELVEAAMREGAFGLSSDLQSEPASYSTNDELTALARATARYGGFYSVRVRDENEKITESLGFVCRFRRLAPMLPPFWLPSIKHAPPPSTYPRTPRPITMGPPLKRKKTFALCSSTRGS